MKKVAYIVVLLGALLIATFAIWDEDKPKAHFTRLEVIDVKGSCYEDHVRQADSYGGQIIRSRDDDTNKISTYGFVTNANDSGMRVVDEVTHPTVYHTPDIIELWDIQTDTRESNWTVHGVSNRGENEKGYDATCELNVTKRGNEIADPISDTKAVKTN